VAQLDCTHLAPPSPRTSALSAIVVEEVTSPVPLTVVHFIPVTSAESAVRTCQLVPAARREAVFAPVHPARSHLASHIASVATDPPPDITISPLPSRELEFIVLILVQETRVACFQASPEVRAEVSALSVLSAVKLSLIFHLVINQLSLLFRVCNVDIVYS
jgi:hypothetical protein